MENQKYGRDEEIAPRVIPQSNVLHDPKDEPRKECAKSNHACCSPQDGGPGTELLNADAGKDRTGGAKPKDQNGVHSKRLKIKKRSSERCQNDKRSTDHPGR